MAVIKEVTRGKRTNIGQLKLNKKMFLLSKKPNRQVIHSPIMPGIITSFHVEILKQSIFPPGIGASVSPKTWHILKMIITLGCHSYLLGNSEFIQNIIIVTLFGLEFLVKQTNNEEKEKEEGRIGHLLQSHFMRLKIHNLNVCLYSGGFEHSQTLEYLSTSFSPPHPHASSVSHLPFGKFLELLACILAFNISFFQPLLLITAKVILLKTCLFKTLCGTSLVVQWLRLHASTGGHGFDPCSGN